MSQNANKLFVFDMDGTLFDSMDDITLNVKRAFDYVYFNFNNLSKKFANDLSGVDKLVFDSSRLNNDNVRPGVGHGVIDLLEAGLISYKVLPNAKIDTSFEHLFDRSNNEFMMFLVEKFNEIYGANLVEKTKFFPNAESTIKKLFDDGHTLAILSNKFDAEVKYIINRFGVTNLFKLMVGFDTYNIPKPQPGGLINILKELGFEDRKQDCYMIGDTNVDIDAGVGAGVNTVFCTYGIGKAGSSKPTFSIDNMSELLDIANGKR